MGTGRRPPATRAYGRRGAVSAGRRARCSSSPDGSRRSLRVEEPDLFAETAQANLPRGGRAREAVPIPVCRQPAKRGGVGYPARDRIAIGSASVAAVDARSQKAPREIWRGIAFLALCLMAFEWYAYHRRL